MNLLRPVYLFSFLVLLCFGCGGGETATETETSTHVMSEVFAPATYTALIDSAAGSGEISTSDKDLLLGFIRENSRVIPAERSLGSLLEGAKGHQKMNAEGVTVRVGKVNITTDKKIYGFHMHLTAFNQSEASIRRFRGVIDWLDSEGNVLKSSPRFSMRGNMAPGDSLGNVLLETAYYKPTGNELNNDKQKAWRDTLRMMEKSAGTENPDRFRFRLLDLQLSNGLTPQQFWLKSSEQRAEVAQTEEQEERPMGLLNWAKRNTEWMEKLTAGLGEHYLEVTPILTNKGELTHGEYLMFDRIIKVQNFFVRQQKVPRRRINPSGMNGELVHFEEVDFWKWPMELRIFAADVE